MSRKPVAATAAANNTQEFDISKVKYANIASAATKDGSGKLVKGGNTQTSITLDSEFAIPKLLKILGAVMNKAETDGSVQKVTLNCYPTDPSKHSDKFNSYYNMNLKVNLANLEEKGIISKEEYFDRG